MPKGKATQRCLPAAKARSLTKKQRAATARKKVRGSKKGKQFVKNTKKAKVKLKKEEIMEQKELLNKIKAAIKKTLEKEGGASGLKPLKKSIKNLDKPKGFDLEKTLDKMSNVKQHKDSDYILTPISEDNGAMKKSKKGMAMYGKGMNKESLEELKGLFEKLCKKGQAYRRKRMAAGEKSSAYLSGRAVKVCKGQIKGEAEDAAMKKSALGMAMYGKKVKMREESATEVNVFGYQTQHFDICPSAYALYKKIVDENLVDDKDLVIRVAKLHDNLFYLEKMAIEKKIEVTSDLVDMAQNTADLIMSAAKEKMNLEKEHNYVQGHVDTIKDLMGGGTVDEAKKKSDDEEGVADNTEFKLTLKHLLDKHVVKGGLKKVKDGSKK